MIKLDELSGGSCLLNPIQRNLPGENMEDQSLPLPEEEIEHLGGVVSQLSGNNVEFSSGVAGKVSAAQDVNMDRSVAAAVAAGRDMQLRNGYVEILAVGRDMDVVNGASLVTAIGQDLKLDNGAVGIANVGGDVHMTDSIALASATSQIIAQDSLIGVLFSGRTNLGEGSRVLLNTPQALAFGAAFGAAFASLLWLLKRK
jgi:hypothetical protein